MAGNRKKQSAAIRFGPALKAAFLCLMIGGSAVGYVWQKSQIYQLGKDIRQRERDLTRMKAENQRLRDQLAMLRSPVVLDQRVRQLNLGLVPAQPGQMLLLPEPGGLAGTDGAGRQFAARQGGAPLTQ